MQPAKAACSSDLKSLGRAPMLLKMALNLPVRVVPDAPRLLFVAAVHRNIPQL
jgi:hypothetical protein